MLMLLFLLTDMGPLFHGDVIALFLHIWAHFFMVMLLFLLTDMGPLYNGDVIVFVTDMGPLFHVDVFVYRYGPTFLW